MMSFAATSWNQCHIGECGLLPPVVWSSTAITGAVGPIIGCLTQVNATGCPLQWNSVRLMCENGGKEEDGKDDEG